MRPLGLLATTAAFALLLGVTVPARALIVFDPTNYVQNVLTAARELQQVNNQITSLQNEAQMLINQARNLASLPYSSLQQLQSSIQRTQQLPVELVGEVQVEIGQFAGTGVHPRAQPPDLGGQLAGRQRRGGAVHGSIGPDQKNPGFVVAGQHPQ